jgi:hypothetical protein
MRSVLEQVYETDYVLVLANLQHFNFASLLKNFNMGHIFLFHLLNSDFDSRLQVLSHFYKAELAFAKCLFEFIKIKHITVAHNLLELLFPSLSFSLRLEV